MFDEIVACWKIGNAGFCCSYQEIKYAEIDNGNYIAYFSFYSGPVDLAVKGKNSLGVYANTGTSITLQKVIGRNFCESE